MTAEVFIPLGKGKIAVIDFEDWNLIRSYTWTLKTNGKNKKTYYAYGYKREAGRGISTTLHREIMGEYPLGLELAHKDGDGLNNRRDNLKFVTHQQNLQGRKMKKENTTSLFRGVRLHQRGKWTAQLSLNGKQVALGCFTTEIEAAKAYDAGARKYFGEHAAPNFPI